MTNAKLIGPGTRVGMLHLVPPLRVAPDDGLSVVASRMSDSGTSLAVLAGPDVAVVTERDLVRALGEGLGPSTPASRVATRQPVTVTVDTPLGAAAEAMLSQCVRHLLVVDESGAPVGVLSVREALRTLLRVAGPDWSDWADRVEGP